ncbi:MAG TPA: hypothetical protein VII38_20850, partial [Polyangia bacterium]
NVFYALLAVNHILAIANVDFVPPILKPPPEIRTRINYGDLRQRELFCGRAVCRPSTEKALCASPAAVRSTNATNRHSRAAQ